MASHVRVLAILQIVYSSLGVLLSIVVFMLFGGIAALVGVSAPLDDSVVAVPVLAVIGGVAASMIMLLSLPRLIAGIGLLQHRNWARILTLVVSAIGLLDFPFGTALGVYGFWVLLQRDTVPLFEGAVAHR